ncbi:MAG: CHAT domain-containing protein [Proteobacteria bacterium]|nr:CHAT domain-containing protein [Pseudomonadota bacterium]MCP4918304.1 CHAT domain-containing protein [Pseudomonadota bacterium]
MVLHLRLVELRGQLELRFGDHEAVLSAETVQRLRQLAAPDDKAVDVELTEPGEDEGWRLGELLQATPVWGALHRALPSAGESGRPAVLAITTPEDLAGLPWERLFVDGDAPLEVERRAVVARLHNGEGQPQSGENAFELLRWSPTAEDQGCGRISHRLDELGASLDIQILEFENQLPSGNFVFQIVLNGRQTEVLRSHLDRGPSGRLGLVLSRCACVVLSVRQGSEADCELLARRLIELGAPSVVAPASEVGVESVQRFSDGFYQALAAHATAAEAVAEGRRKVRAWGRRHPEARWSRWRWYVAGLDAAATGALRPPSWRPEGWPNPAADAAALLDRARELSLAQGVGYLGVEHVVAALRQVDGGGKTTAQIRATLPRMDQFQAALAALSPQPGDSELRLSPRLAGWRSGLTDGFSLDDVCSVLAMDLAKGLAGVRPGTGDPAKDLTVLGGPEDGRVMELDPGQTLGRYSDNDGPTHGLYGDVGLTDRKLSRQHLTWTGPGKVELKRAARRFRSGEIARVGPGEVDLLAGDLLVLTHATRLICG